MWHDDRNIYCGVTSTISYPSTWQAIVLHYCVFHGKVHIIFLVQVVDYTVVNNECYSQQSLIDVNRMLWWRQKYILLFTIHYLSTPSATCCKESFRKGLPNRLGIGSTDLAKAPRSSLQFKPDLKRLWASSTLWWRSVHMSTFHFVRTTDR